MPWWYGVWGLSPWFIFLMLMCVGMMAMMLLMGRGHMGHEHMGGHGRGHMGEARTDPIIDPALETLRQRFASGELTRQEYEEQRDLLLRV
jgi:uncharacterized membrane protein